jgi:starch phosphorylase
MRSGFSPPAFEIDSCAFGDAVERTLRYAIGRRRQEASADDVFQAVALAARDHMIDRMHATEDRYRAADAKRLYYLSVEFLIGRSLVNNLLNLGILGRARMALERLGLDLDAAIEAEPDAALGNGGLGRLAACFLDSLASLDLPGFGYGINYEHGLFRQAIENGHQREYPDSWRGRGSPWLIERVDHAVHVPVYGHVEARPGDGALPHAWLGSRVLVGVPHDMPIVGYGGHTVNVLRLYSARASDEFDIGIFHRGDYARAVGQKLDSERITKVLYPPDSYEAGRELRLLQEYFFVACALRDIVARFRQTHRDFERFPERVAIQLNDTHPALAVAELVRLLACDHDVPFERAVELARRSFAYTNHTLLPEALERWPRPLLERVVPLHLRIVEEINARFLTGVERRWPGDVERLRRMSIIEEGHPQQVRMAHLAIVGSHAVNGVSALHSELVRTSLVPDFAELWPERFQNKTNGISHRRWLWHANPGLSSLITSRIGSGWVHDLERLRALEAHVDDPEFRVEFLRAKRSNKERLAAAIERSTGVALDPAMLFDVQVKRIHEYKRQLLAALQLASVYLETVDSGRPPETPRAFVFAGKAAPEYFMAKLIIKLVCEIARTVNDDPRSRDHLRVVFVPDYRVTLAELIIPAAELSQQISTAGREASGTGNMKLALNGALTVGTLDGANIEILEAVGEENVYIFGLRADEVADLQRRGAYDPRGRYEKSERLRHVIDALASDRFSPREAGIFRPFVDQLLHHGDPYFVLADFDAYCAVQARAAHDYRDREAWARRSALNVARMGYFSSDRTVREYARDIWKLEPVR